MPATLLRGGTILAMDAGRRILRADLLVEDGCIARIGKGIRAPRGVGVIDCAGKAVLPGLVQAHVHLCQALFRNHADGLELLDWLEQRIWPYEAAHDARSLRFSARLGIAELVLSGTTCVLDMATVRHTEEVLRAAEESGIRYTGGKCLMDGASSPPALREDTAAALDEAERLGTRWHGVARGRIRWALCPRFVLSCTDEMLRGVRELSSRHGWLVHTHSSENRAEVEEVRARTGKDNVEHLARLGLGGAGVVLAHCVHVTAREGRLMARSGTSAVHCPGANLKLASGIAPVPRLLSQGVNVALGADGAPCNNSLDVFHEMRLAATLHLPGFGARAMPAAEVLAMATIRGARALGLERQIGSLEVGKRADVTVVDLRTAHASPAGDDLHGTVVYSARASDVTDVLVDGRAVVRERRLLTLDAGALARAAPAEVARVLRRVRTPRPRPRARRGPAR
ncbi:MAG: 5'-deoxyadenosine deaminase [Myxococcales bacterium]